MRLKRDFGSNQLKSIQKQIFIPKKWPSEFPPFGLGFGSDLKVDKIFQKWFKWFDCKFVLRFKT